jgi:hypothetical protein
MRVRLLIAASLVAISAALFTPARAFLIQTEPRPASPPAQPAEKEKIAAPNPLVGQALGTLVKAKADMAINGSFSCCIKPGCNFCPLAADKCPCRSNVKTPMGVCGECKAGWEAGVGAVDGVQPQNVQQIKARC